MKKLALLVLFALALPVLVRAGEEVTITFPNRVVGMTRHGNLLVIVHYRADDRNQELELSWESDQGEGGSSTVAINDRNNGIPLAENLDLSAGSYTFTATLYRNDGSTAVATQTRFVTR